METIRAAAVRHNQPAGVHTALLHQSGWFVQWKEGPPDAVATIMDRIARDPRHRSMRLLHHSVGQRLLPGVWTMAIVQCADCADDFGRRVEALHGARQRGQLYLPAACWRMLSTPQRHPRAAQQPDGEAFQRVLLCSAQADDAFVLVAKLAAQQGADIVHRRFAGPCDLDVGTDYIDIEDAGRVLRLIAMARKGLGLGLTLAFLSDYSHLVMLFSGDAAADGQLFSRVLQACAGLCAVPILLGLGATDADNRRMFALAHQRGVVYLHAPGSARSLDEAAATPARQPWLDDWADIHAHLQVARRHAGTVSGLR